MTLTDADILRMNALELSHDDLFFMNLPNQLPFMKMRTFGCWINQLDS